MKNVFNTLLYLALLFQLLNLGPVSNAQQFSQSKNTQQSYKGIIQNVLNRDNFQELQVVITNKDLEGKEVQVSNDPQVSTQTQYKVGDKVMLLKIQDVGSDKTQFYVTDYDRTASLIWLFIIFCTVVIIVSKKWGIYSILGMFYSFLIIFKFILPLLLKGHNPLMVAIAGSLLIVPVTFYLSHGINKKTTVALISTVVSLSITGLLSLIFINSAKLTGFGSEESFFLQIAKQGTINVKGLLLAGIIIGTLGILDDVTVSQASIVNQLKGTVRGLEGLALYNKAMAIGHDHIASAVNTLVLVYAGAALPLLLLFVSSDKTFGEAINNEMIASEIVTTLVGSIGLVLAVPISTLFAVSFVDGDTTTASHGHAH